MRIWTFFMEFAQYKSDIIITQGSILAVVRSSEMTIKSYREYSNTKTSLVDK